MIMNNIEQDAPGVIGFVILTKEVGLWSAYNFGVLQNPWLGMVEEVGELAHCLLKRTQRIRGYQDPAFFLEQFKDALGDIGIYAANYAYNERIRIEYPKVEGKAGYTINKHLSNALFWLSQLMLAGERDEDYATWLKNVLMEVSCIALIEGLDLQEVTSDTWTKVKLRNWKKNSHDGTTKTYAENVMVDEKEKGEEGREESTTT